MSQRFCLRWNNHQSNMLSVFDQLLHDESFVDVTLAVDGHLFKAHKMVLSACSPLFQALFIGHPDKHPIVILKDVPYADMRCLLDFMYRGEVSVDQDRLTPFLKVAESLRIKGLTEVNEEKCDIPSITNNLLSSLPNAQTPPPPPPPPPHLHRIPPGNSQPKRTLPPLVASNPLLGSALTAPKRKRGRPRKLSGSSNGDPSHTRDNSPHDDPIDLEFDARLGHGSSGESLHSSPPPLDMMEMHMDYGHAPTPAKAAKTSANRLDSVSRYHDGVAPAKEGKMMQHLKKSKDEHEPTPGTSQDAGHPYRSSSNNINSAGNLSSGNGSLNNSSGGQGIANTDSFSSGQGCSSVNRRILSQKIPIVKKGLGESQLSSSAITPTAAATPSKKNAVESQEWEDEKYADMITNSPLPLDEEQRRKLVPEDLPLPLPVLNILPKKEIFDKRKLTRPRKLTDILTINNEAAFPAEAPDNADRDMSRTEYEAFESLVDRPEMVSTPTSEVEQRDGNGNSIVQEVGRSVRQFCVKEPGNLFRCRMCSRTYTHISNFCRHFITTHRGIKQAIPCPICNKRFTRKDNMVTHMKMVHGFNRNDRPPVVSPNP